MLLTVYYGLDWHENRKQLLAQVCDCRGKAEESQVLVVPDQFSHEMERSLCQTGGPSISRYAEVLSFSRLADRVFSVGGGIADVQLDQGGRLLAMASAVNMIRSRLKKYGSCGEKPEFLLQALQTIDEFKAFCLMPEDLHRAALRTQGELAVKLEELALLCEGYEAACANGTQDSGGRMLQLLDCLKLCDYDRNKAFFFEGFSTFDRIERQIIATLLDHGCPVCVFVVCDDPRDGQHVFDEVRKTVDALKDIARRQQCSIEIREVVSQDTSSSMQHLRKNLFAGIQKPYQGTEKKIFSHEAQDIHREVADLAGRILAHIQGGGRYRDIAVVCGDPETYRPVLQNMFARYQIPAYFAGSEKLITKPPVQAVLRALEAASYDMDTEMIFAFLKSALSPLPRNSCDRLENYVYTWNIHGNGWQASWTMHPDGYGAERDARSDEALKEINRDRMIAIEPLLSLRKALNAAANTAEQVLALNDFLEKIRFREKMSLAAKQFTEQQQLQRAQEYAQLYQIMMDALEQFYRVLGKTVHTPDSFYCLLHSLLSQYDVGTIPATLDCVSIGSVNSMQRTNTPIVCIIGACDGMLPTAPEEVGLLSEDDRKVLQKMEISVAPGLSERLNRELHGIYQVMTAATEELYVSAVAGKPAYLFRRLAELFPARKISAENIPELVLRSAVAAEEYLAQLRHQPVKPASVQRLIQCLPNQGQKLIQAYAKADSTPGTLRKETVTELYGKTLRLSASKIDKYARCPYGYFLEYGLRAKERKRATFDAPLYGDLVHRVLENTAKEVMRKGGFHQLSSEQVLDIAGTHIQQFTQELMADTQEVSERFLYLYERNLTEIREVVENLCSELQQSEFEPAYFELKFSKGEQMPSIQVVGTYMNGELEGKVDRIDLCTIGSAVYARVVDYKTGRKQFDYTDILNGIGLQMLIYLFALEQGGKKAMGVQFRPSGVLYMPARFSLETAKEPADTEKTEAIRQNAFRRNGLLLQDETVLDAMEPGEKKVFLPKGEDYLATAEQMQMLQRFVYQSLRAMVDGVASGNVTPNPYYRGSNDNACLYCPYGTVCHVRSGCVSNKVRAKRGKQQFWAEVEEKVSG